MKQVHDESGRQILWGGLILLGLAVLLCGVLLGWRYLPGIWGEWLGTMVGVVTTPFFMEAGCAGLGLTLVLLINHLRQRREGAELVYLEQAESVAEIPDHARWAIYRHEPLAGESPSLLEQAEGALAIGDLETASECFAAMPEEELGRREVIEQRLVLARLSGRDLLAESLEKAMSEARGAAK